eukprot:CAMPEP_0198652214 /NCGR_PEP_ID=MMETSP1467-20131203/6223_1 /TAXON_ID=1462469 /ORGANISM="unid. sp., Strain CCMP2135" /LENGTH=164 /DNA_ID=CAMNT_0044388123 /DNA_START=66 /DNA_END=560 /DNA_ORIENTATION=+
MSSSKTTAAVDAEAVQGELPINPAGDVPYVTATTATPLTVTGQGEEEYIHREAHRAARRNSSEMKNVLNTANRVGRDRTKLEESSVRVAERRAVYVDATDPTYVPPHVAVATPLMTEEDDPSSKKLADDAAGDEEKEDVAKPYTIGNYDTTDYKISDYKSIYEP